MAWPPHQPGETLAHAKLAYNGLLAAGTTNSSLHRLGMPAHNSNNIFRPSKIQQWTEIYICSTASKGKNIVLRSMMFHDGRNKWW